MSTPDRDAAEKALVKLARQSAATWQQIRGQSFLGDLTLETDNTLYHFKDGVFSARAPRPALAGQAPQWESPKSMAGIEIIGFLADEGGLWSLSPRWKPGALAVLWRLGTSLDQPFTLTSPTRRCELSRPVAPVLAKVEFGDVTIRRPKPASMTRLQPARAYAAAR